MKARSLLALAPFLATCFALVACSGSQKKAETPTPATESATEQPDEPPTYVIVHRNTRIHLEPDDDAPYLQYRTPERQAEFDARRAKEEAKRREAREEAEQERRERDRKRAQRRRKRRRKLSWKRRKELRERDAERALDRRRERAADELRDVIQRAKKDLIEAPDRPWIPFRLVGEKDGWLQLAPVIRGEHPGHCYRGTFGQVDRLSADFWVKPDDLVQVVDHRVRVPVHEGTEVILIPGVALRPLDEEDHYRVYVDGFVLELEIPSDSVGTEYRPHRPFEAPRTDTVITPEAWTEEKLTLGPGQPFRFNPYRPMFVTGTLFVGSKFFVSTQTRCAEYTVRASEEDIAPVERRGATRLAGGAKPVDPPYARKGAVVYLPDGSEFGRVEVNFPLGKPTTDHEGRPCFRTAVWGSTDAAVTRGLELCFDAADLEMPAPEE